MRRLLTALALLAAVATGGACTVTDSAPPQDTNSGIRHNLEPLTKRYPAAGKPVSATWRSMTRCPHGNDRLLPGPCDTRLEAIITLEPGVARGLRSAYLGGARPDRPQLADELAASLPPGDYETSDGLNKAMSTYWPADAYLHVDLPILVVSGGS
ncbi:MAG: hypothetical protein QM728_02205 [Gordonia sp. (in: high G+C Gram-positive bacteria)]|uniref:hypothetical protein n=1 Tax=Gordonia sp. (in: high G+C Gram-positive bacteria) TaxID=84139 RepID=UPI0039E6CB42